MITISIIITLISLSLIIIFGLDKVTSENPSDSAFIHIGLSNIDTSGCNACTLGGSIYYSGCEKCKQDSIVFFTRTSIEDPYLMGWSNDMGIYRGDDICSGEITLSTKAFSGDTYWIEMTKNDLDFKTTMYTDPNYSQIQDLEQASMCSNPTNLKYFRITTEDGKPAGNGGKIVGYIDDIQLWDNFSTIKDKSEKIISQVSSINALPTKFSEDFSDCTSSDCNKSWIVNNPQKLFVDVENKNFHFNSQVTGTNDKAHYELDSFLSDKWTLRFKFHIEDLVEHPHGKGILQIDPDIRRLVFGIPAIVLPITGYFISRKIPSKTLSIILIVNGLLVIAGIGASFYSNNLGNTMYENKNLIELILATILGAFIVFLGILKIQTNKILILK